MLDVKCEEWVPGPYTYGFVIQNPEMMVLPYFERISNLTD